MVRASVAENGKGLIECDGREAADALDDYLTEQCDERFSVKFEGDIVLFYLHRQISLSEIDGLVEGFQLQERGLAGS